MASWREIDRVRKDARVRDIARHLLDHCADSLSTWEGPFLEDLARSRVKEFTTRQSEKLLEIRDKLAWVDKFDGFSVKGLLQRCWEARLDLSETDEEWIAAAYKRNAAAIRRREVGHLARCSRQLGFIESEVDA